MKQGIKYTIIIILFFVAMYFVVSIFSNRYDKVEYENNQYSLSGLADKLLRELGYDWKSVQGSNFFEYNGKTLYQIKKDLEDEETEDSEEDTI
mgnify:CR=1 FL=1